jgi:hypothetical protein
LKPRRLFLIALLISLTVAAALGMMGVITSTYGDRRLMGSMLSIALFSLTLLGTAIVIDKRRWRLVMFLSTAISAAGLALFLFMTWFGDSVAYPLHRQFEHVMKQLAYLAVALPMAGLLSLTRFAHPILRGIRIGTLTLVFLCAGTLSFAIWREQDLDFDQYFSVLGVISIGTGLGVVGLPLLHKLAGMPPPSETVAMDVRVTIVCPRCGTAQTVAAGESRCQRCKLRFFLEVEEPRCPKCSYLLFQLTEPRCPECGQALSGDDVMIGEPVRARQPV